MMAKKYYVNLGEDEREQLEQMLQRGKASGFKLRHAAILLKLDEIEANKDWTQKKIADAYGNTEATVINIAAQTIPNNAKKLSQDRLNIGASSLSMTLLVR